MDVRVRRKVKRDIYNEKRLRVIWDEDGETVQQTYVYTPNEPGLWVAEQLRPLEREMMARGISKSTYFNGCTSCTLQCPFLWNFSHFIQTCNYFGPTVKITIVNLIDFKYFLLSINYLWFDLYTVILFQQWQGYKK